MNYQEYINSPKWKHKRLLRLKVDNFKCRTCWNTEELEVHHLTYDRLGYEELSDLITLCRHCHEAITNSIRERRYKGREINFSNQQGVKLSYVETAKSEIDWSITPDNAQRRISKPVNAIIERDEEDLFKAEKDRFRLRRTGKT